MYSESLWQCQWWTRGNTPGADASISRVWLLKKECNGTQIENDICSQYRNTYSYTVFRPNRAYCRYGSEYVKYGTSIYMCKYDTTGTIPGEDSVWLLKQDCDHQDDTDITSPNLILTILIFVHSYIIALSVF
eukprot:523998_1